MLDIAGVSKSFGATAALRGVSLEVRPGEFHALLGENGAGKSTLVKVIAGAHAPDSGTLTWEGAPLRPADSGEVRRRGIGVVYQESSLVPEFTVAANMALGREPVRGPGWIDWGAVRSELGEQARRFGATVDPDARARDLSVGERKLVEILRVVEPGLKLIVLDEPTAAFTVEDTARLMAVLGELKAAGTAILYVTHRLQEIADVVDRVSILKDGEHVATLGREEATPGRVVSLMVGREIGDMYQSEAGSGTGEVAVSVRGLGRSSRFRDVDFEIHRGEIAAFVGLDGHGSFDAARALFGAPPAERGVVVIDGKEARIGSIPEARSHGIGFIGDDRADGLFASLSVRDNLAMAAIRRWTSRLGWIDTRGEGKVADELIDFLRIRTSSAAAPVSSLSGGNQQKVMLGRWLAVDPRLLVLLDPTAGVDVGARADIYRLLRAAAEKGTAILMATSDLAEALAVADVIYAFYQGEIAAVFPRDRRTEAGVVAAMTGHATAAATVTA